MYIETNEGDYVMTEKNSYYAATITHLACNGVEWQEVIVYVNLKKLEALCADMLTCEDDCDEILRVEIHERTYTKKEVQELSKTVMNFN